MAAASHIPTKLGKAQGGLTSGQAVNLGSDTFMALWVVAGSGLPSMNSTGIQFVADVTATNAENTTIGARPTLGSVTWAFDGSGVAVDWSFANVTYAQNASDNGTSRYWVVYDNTVGTGDSTHPVVAIFDPGAAVSVATASLTLSCPSGGFVQMSGFG